MQAPEQDPEEGATAVEYALMLALIFVVIIAAVTSLGIAVSNSLVVPF
jgi:Flp pilus assembly pilin Flp